MAATGERTAPPDLRVAVAGAGAMARNHLQVLSDLEGVRVVGVADPSSTARTAAVAGVSPEPTAQAPTLGALLDAVDADVVHVCTPMETHVEVAREALGRGCHVYVEKPVAESSAELDTLLETAADAGLLLCGGHQLLFATPYQRILDLLPALGTLAHAESYFSFRPVRTAPANGRPLTTTEQLLDVLPHPTYLLADLLERSEAGDSAPEPALTALELSGDGTVHALARRGDLTGCLTVTVEGRPVEHRLRLVGGNGTVEADFVRGTVQRLLGPGTTAPEKALAPFRLSGQLALGSAAALSRRVLASGSGYPGLPEIIQAFHSAIRAGDPSPTPPGQLRATVQAAESVAHRLLEREDAATPKGANSPEPSVLVTGGTGLLGREVARRLSRDGHGIRSVSRRPPEPRQRLAGVEYRVADLAEGVPEELLRGIEVVVHCAAGTAGNREAHRRNTVEATEGLLRAAASAGVGTFVHVSSVAVQGAPSGKDPVRDEDPVHPRPEVLGPYAWGKAEAERRAVTLADDLGVRLKVVRPVPLISPGAFEPPGRLGRRVGNVYVAVGSRREPLAVADASESARAIADLVRAPDAAPDVMNLVPPELPTRGELVSRAKARYPELRVVWLPRPALRLLSWAATLAQRMARPGRPPVKLASAFETVTYAPGPAARWMKGAARQPQRDSPDHSMGPEPRSMEETGAS